MKRIKLNQFFEEPSDNSGSSTSKKEEEVKKEPEDKKTEENNQQKDTTAEEKLKEELAAEKAAREAAETKLKEKEEESLSDDEKKAIQDSNEKEQFLTEYEDLQLEKLGLGKEHRSLIKGKSTKEIREKAEALVKVIGDTKTSTEANVKKEVSKTLVPGGAGDSDNDGEMDSVDYYTEVLGGKN